MCLCVTLCVHVRKGRESVCALVSFVCVLEVHGLQSVSLMISDASVCILCV